MKAKQQTCHEQTLYGRDLSVMYQGETDPITISMPHWHQLIEIIICVEEGHVFTINDDVVKLQHGEILIMGSGIIHGSFRPSQFIGKQYVIRFNVNSISNMFSFENAKKFPSFFVKLFSPYTYYIIKDKAFYDRCLDIAKKLHDLRYTSNINSTEESETDSILLYSYLLMFMHTFLKSSNLTTSQTPHTNTSTGTYETIKKTATYIQQHYREKITMEEMAQMANLSYTYYSQQFKKIMGSSFNSFLTSVRLAAADDMISSGKYTLKEISERVGITPQSSFNHTYKKIRGVSPKQFRLQIKKSTNISNVHGW